MRIGRTLVAPLAVVAVLGVGCARSHLFYDARELRHPAFDSDQKAALAQALAGKLEGRKLVWVDDEGHEHDIPSTEAGLKKLGLAELGALWLMLSNGDVGGEADVRVRAGKSTRPISVFVALDGDVRVETGHNEKSDEPALSENAIRDRFNLDAKLPGKWEEAERRALTESLSLLTDVELDVVRNIPFDREPKAAGGDPSRAALYVQNGCKAKIFLYATGVKSDRFRFVGDAREPRSAVLHALVHEIGHAVAGAPSRALYCEAERNKKKANDLIGRANDIISRGPVIDAYRDAADGEPAPTDYGNESIQEAFAESFALFHVDPAALKRARPKIFAWFAAGGHRKALGH